MRQVKAQYQRGRQLIGGRKISHSFSSLKQPETGKHRQAIRNELRNKDNRGWTAEV